MSVQHLAILDARSRGFWRVFVGDRDVALVDLGFSRPSKLH